MKSSRREEQTERATWQSRAHAVTKDSPNIITAFASHIAKTRHFEGLGSVLVDAADNVHVTERRARVRHLRGTVGGGAEIAAGTKRLGVGERGKMQRAEQSCA